MKNFLAVVAIAVPFVAGIYLNGIPLIVICLLCTILMIFLAKQNKFVDAMAFYLLPLVFNLLWKLSAVQEYLRHPIRKTITPDEIIEPFYMVAIVIVVARLLVYAYNIAKGKENL